MERSANKVLTNIQQIFLKHVAAVPAFIDRKPLRKTWLAAGSMGQPL
jgi:hypothetical protein